MRCKGEMGIVSVEIKKGLSVGPRATEQRRESSRGKTKRKQYAKQSEGKGKKEGKGSRGCAAVLSPDAQRDAPLSLSLSLLPALPPHPPGSAEVMTRR